MVFLKEHILSFFCKCYDISIGTISIHIFVPILAYICSRSINLKSYLSSNGILCIGIFDSGLPIIP